MSKELDEAIQAFNIAISEALKRAVAKDTATPILRLFLKDKKLKEDSKTPKRRPGADFIENLNKLSADETAKTIKANFETIEDEMFKKTGESSEKNIDWKEVKNDPKTYAKVCKNTVTKIKEFVNSVKKTHLKSSTQGKKLLKRLNKCIQQIELLQKEENLKSKSNTVNKDTVNKDTVNKDISEAINTIMKLKGKDFLDNINKIYNGDKNTNNLSLITRLQSNLKIILLGGNGFNGVLSKEITNSNDKSKNNSAVVKLNYKTDTPITDYIKDKEGNIKTNCIGKNNKNKLLDYLGGCSMMSKKLITDSFNSNNITEYQLTMLSSKVEKLFNYCITNIGKSRKAVAKAKIQKQKRVEKLANLAKKWNSDTKYKKSLTKLATKYNDENTTPTKKKDILKEALQLMINGRFSWSGSIDQYKLTYFIHRYKARKLEKNPFFSKVSYDEDTVKDVLKDYGFKIDENTI